MANILSLLNTIKNAIYGKDMRIAIHDGIEAVNDEINEHKSLPVLSHPDGCVTTEKIDHRAVGREKIKMKAVGTDEIDDEVIVSRHIGNKQVTTSKLADKCITNYQLADNAVETHAIANDAVTEEKIADAAVTTEKFAAVAGVDKLGGIKLYGSDGNNKSGINVSSDGTAYIATNNGLYRDESGGININPATDAEISIGTEQYKPVVPKTLAAYMSRHDYALNKYFVKNLNDYSLDYSTDGDGILYAKDSIDPIPTGLFVFTPEQDVKRIILVSPDGGDEYAGCVGPFFKGHWYLLNFIQSSPTNYTGEIYADVLTGPWFNKLIVEAEDGTIPMEVYGTKISLFKHDLNTFVKILDETKTIDIDDDDIGGELKIHGMDIIGNNHGAIKKMKSIDAKEMSIKAADGIETFSVNPGQMKIGSYTDANGTRLPTAQLEWSTNVTSEKTVNKQVKFMTGDVIIKTNSHGDKVTFIAPEFKFGTSDNNYVIEVYGTPSGEGVIKLRSTVPNPKGKNSSITISNYGISLVGDVFMKEPNVNCVYLPDDINAEETEWLSGYLADMLLQLRRKSSPSIVTNTTDTVAVTPEADTEYRYGTLTSLSITVPVSLPDDYAAYIAFTSGETATELNYPDTIKWNGDDVIDGVFTPLPSQRYNIGLWYDGEYMNAVARGVDV